MSDLTTAQILGAAPVMVDGRPNIRTNQQVSLIAQAVADNLPSGALYRYHDEYVTISTIKSTNQDGETTTELEKRPMDPPAFHNVDRTIHDLFRQCGRSGGKHGKKYGGIDSGE